MLGNYIDFFIVVEEVKCMQAFLRNSGLGDCMNNGSDSLVLVKFKIHISDALIGERRISVYSSSRSQKYCPLRAMHLVLRPSHLNYIDLMLLTTGVLWDYLPSKNACRIFKN